MGAGDGKKGPFTEDSAGLKTVWPLSMMRSTEHETSLRCSNRVTMPRQIAVELPPSLQRYRFCIPQLPILAMRYISNILTATFEWPSDSPLIEPKAFEASLPR